MATNHGADSSYSTRYVQRKLVHYRGLLRLETGLDAGAGHREHILIAQQGDARTGLLDRFMYGQQVAPPSGRNRACDRLARSGYENLPHPLDGASGTAGHHCGGKRRCGILQEGSTWC